MIAAAAIALALAAGPPANGDMGPWPEEPPLAPLLAALPSPKADAARLRELVSRADALAASGAYAQAAQLYEVAAADPAFADLAFADERKRAQAELPRALLDAGLCRPALMAALALAHVKDGRAGIGQRVATDAALRCAGPAESEALAALPPGSPDAKYLAGKRALEAGDPARARALLSAVPPDHRLAAGARYLAALAALKLGDAATSESELRALAKSPEEGSQRALFEDARTPGVRDLARLALARLLHEAGKEKEALAAYALVPQDSPRSTEARFEAGWAAYDARDARLALALALDVLDRAAPPALHAEALLLAGHARLALGDGDGARPRFAEAAARLAAYASDSERAAAAAPPPPALARAAREGAALARELEGVPRLVATWRALGGADWVMPRPPQLDAKARLAAGLARLSRKLAAAAQEEAASPDDVLRAREAYLELAGAADRELRRPRELPGAPAGGKGFEASAAAAAYASEIAFLDRLAGRAGPLAAPQEPPAAFAVAQRERMNALAAEARLGEVDALLGHKRRLEREVRMLARGEVPPSMLGAALRGGLLREDEEYWPYEGEWWPDEVEVVP